MKPALRISVTDLDQLAYYRQSDTMTLDELLDRLLRRTPPSPAMRAGSAFHSVLERAQAGDVLDDLEQDGFRFRFACEADLALPPVRELKAVRPMYVDGHEVALVGKVDAISAGRVWDHKLTGRCDMDRYADSIQWRAYLHMFSCQRFTYNVFTHRTEGDVVIITGVETFDFWWYPQLANDVREAVADFVAFAKQHMPHRLAA